MPLTIYAPHDILKFAKSIQTLRFDRRIREKAQGTGRARTTRKQRYGKEEYNELSCFHRKQHNLPISSQIRLCRHRRRKQGGFFLTFDNVLKRGDLSVTKTAEDGFVEDKTFHLYGTSLSGLPVDEYAVTDERGVATFEDVLISGSTPYTLEEVGTEDKYVIPDPQQATVEWNKVTHKSFNNILKKWRATLTKSDSETGTAQGDATLENAEYGVFKDGQLVDSYFTGPNGDFTTDWYNCGEGWTIKELEPSEGYKLNPEVYEVGAEPELYELEYNEAAVDADEDVLLTI